MSDYVTLLGSEDIKNASYMIRDAAHTMTMAANQIDESLRRHEQFLEDWLQRLEEALNKER